MNYKKYYSGIINLAWETILLVDCASGKIVDVNQNACEKLGYTRKELLQLYISDIDPVYNCKKLKELTHIIGVGNNTVIETTHKRKDGSTFPVEINIGILSIDDKSFFLAFARDIIFKEESILENISDGVFTIDNKTWKITFFNRAAEKITGLTREDALGRHCSEVFRSSLCEVDCTLKATLETGNSIINKPCYIIKADGSNIPISVSTAVLRNSKGNIVGGAVTFRDLSEIEDLRKKLGGTSKIDGFTSHSPSMYKIINLIPTVAESLSTVLIQGETGTGKEVLAKAIHSLSLHNEGPFIAVNCGALPDTLLESELFGYKKGAFTGAGQDKKGRFALARNGTLFLDEIGDISQALQVRLLRVLQDHTFEPLGSTKSEKTNARIIAATNKDLYALVSEGKFREDLYYRINVLCINLPPLRNRKEDIPLLIDSFIQRFNQIQKKNIKRVSAEVLSFFMSYNWPGNIRELENVIERAFILCSSDIIKMRHLPDEMYSLSENPIETKNIKRLKDIVETQAVKKALERNKYNRTLTAKELGIDKSTLFRKMKKFGLDTLKPAKNKP
jgi:PAS domain S-box-containing protein